MLYRVQMGPVMTQWSSNGANGAQRSSNGAQSGSLELLCSTGCSMNFERSSTGFNEFLMEHTNSQWRSHGTHGSPLEFVGAHWGLACMWGRTWLG